LFRDNIIMSLHYYEHALWHQAVSHCGHEELARRYYNIVVDCVEMENTCDN
jgi:hypothetical protein